MSAAPPQVLALVLCDAAWQDPATGKHTLLGLFSAIHTAESPIRHQGFTVYLALTEIYGSAPLAIRLLAPDGTPVQVHHLTIDARDPRTCVEIALRLPPLTLTTPGTHTIDVEAAGHHLASRRLIVTVAK